MIYVVQENPRVNLIPATKFGEIAPPLLRPGDQVVLSSVPTMERLKRGLKGFNDDDYLLLLGDPVAIGMAAMVAANFNRGKVKVLKWDRQERVYYPIQIDLHNTGESDVRFE